MTSHNASFHNLNSYLFNSKMRGSDGYEPLRNPVSRTHAIVAYEMRKAFKGYGLLTGSSVAAKFYFDRRCLMPLHLRHKASSLMHNNDVDMFLPANPYRVDLDRRVHWDIPKEQWQYNRLSLIAQRYHGINTHVRPSIQRISRERLIAERSAPGPIRRWYHRDLEEAASVLLRKHGIMLNIRYIEDFPLGQAQTDAERIDEFVGMDYLSWRMAIFHGITRVYVLEAVDSKGRIQSPPMRITLIDSFPDPDETWSEHISKKFDVNISMGCIRTRRLSKLGTVDISREIRIDLVLGYFWFTIHDLVPFRDLLSRVMLFDPSVRRDICSRRTFLKLRLLALE